MAKAGKATNLKFLRSGLTIQSHVAVAGEVIPLPDGFKVLNRQEQLAMYRKVHYELTNDPVNTGPTATAPFVRIPEPLDDDQVDRPTPRAENIPKKSESEHGGGGGQVNIPAAAMPAPDNDTVPGHEKRAVLLSFEEERKQEQESGDLSTPSRPAKKHKKSKTIVLHRKPLKKKRKEPVAAKPTRMGRSK